LAWKIERNITWGLAFILEHNSSCREYRKENLFWDESKWYTPIPQGEDKGPLRSAGWALGTELWLDWTRRERKDS